MRIRDGFGASSSHDYRARTGCVSFWQYVGRRFLDPKKRRLSRLIALPRKDGRMSRDIIPVEVRSIMRRERDDQSLTWEEIGRKSGLCMREIQSRGSSKIGFRRHVIGSIAETLKSRDLSRLAQLRSLLGPDCGDRSRSAKGKPTTCRSKAITIFWPITSSFTILMPPASPCSCTPPPG